MKIRAVGVELFHADRQTDRQTRRSNFAKAPENNADKSHNPLTSFTHSKNFSKILPSSDLYNEVQ
jgi:hypothetical protein